MEDPESRISYLTESGAGALVEEGGVSGGMMPKLQAAVEAVRSGVRRAHIIDGLADNSLLFEVFTKTGTGTMVISDADESEYLEQG